MCQERSGRLIGRVLLVRQWQSLLGGALSFLTAMVLSVGHWAVQTHAGTWFSPSELMVSTGLSVVAVAGFGIVCAQLCHSAIGGGLFSSAAFLSNGGIAVMSGDQLVPAASAAIALAAASFASPVAAGLCAVAVAMTCGFAGSQIGYLVIVPLAVAVAWLRSSRPLWGSAGILAAGLVGTALAGPLPLIGDIEIATLHSIIGACGTGSGVGLVLTCFGLAILAPVPWRNGGAASLVLAIFGVALTLRAPLLACMGLAIFAAHMARQAATTRGPGIEIIAGIAAILPSAPYVLGLARSIGAIIVPWLSAPSPLAGVPS